MKNFVLAPQDLELVVNEKTLGTLVTNASDIKAAIEQALPNYSIDNYDENNIEQAAKDKALLNKVSKSLNDKRINIEKEFMKPFEEFKDIVSETINLIKTASSKIDIVVKEEIEKTKQNKKEIIKAYWTSTNFNLVSLDKIFNEKWLNKGAKNKDIQDEIQSKQEEIKEGLQTIEAIGEETELLKSLYLDTLNLNETIKKGKILKENKEKAAKEAADRAEAIQIAKDIKIQQENQAKERILKEEKAEAVVNPTKKTSSFTEVLPVIVKEETPIFEVEKVEMLVRIMKVTATREDIIKLGNFMVENKIQFEKVVQNVN